MGKRQAELPGTRRDDEAEPQKPIKALDEICDEIEANAGKVGRARQLLVASLKKAQDLLDEHERDEYEFEAKDGTLKKIFRKRGLGRCKVKRVKRRPDDEEDEE